MVNRNILVLLFSILTLSFLFGDDQSGFIFRYSEDNKPEFIQKICWEGSQYAIKYQFLLKDDTDTIVLDTETENNFIETSLKYGEYFYKIKTYNILEQIENETQWVRIKIEQAFLPVIQSMSMDTLYIEKYYGDPLVIIGSDFTENVKVDFRDLTNSNRPKINGVILSRESNKLTIQLKIEELTVGNYQIIITNPGNVYSTKPFAVKYKKPVDILLTGGYGPLLNSYTGNFNQLLLNVFYPVGFQLDLVIFAFKLKYGFLGFGLSSDFTYFDDTKNVSLYIIMFKNSLSFNYLYQFKKYVGILAKLGVGISFTALIFDYGSTKLNKNFMTFDPYITTGVALQIRPYRSISLLIGFDYSQVIYKESTFGFFKPYTSIGYQF